MQKLSAANRAAIKHYVKSGDYDPNDRNWPGQNFVEVVTNADSAIQKATCTRLFCLVVNKNPRCRLSGQTHATDISTELPRRYRRRTLFKVLLI